MKKAYLQTSFFTPLPGRKGSDFFPVFLLFSLTALAGTGTPGVGAGGDLGGGTDPVVGGRSDDTDGKILQRETPGTRPFPRAQRKVEGYSGLLSGHEAQCQYPDVLLLPR